MSLFSPSIKDLLLSMGLILDSIIGHSFKEFQGFQVGMILFLEEEVG